MAKKNTDQKERNETKAAQVAEEVLKLDTPEPQAPPMGVFNLIFNGSTWRVQSNMSAYLQVGVLRGVINKLEQLQLQPVVQPAPAEPAEEAPQEQDDG